MNLPQPLRSPLSRRMLAWTLSTVVLVTLVESAIQLYFSYAEDVGGIRQNIRQTLRHHLPSLSMALYHTDEEHIRMELDALQQDPDLVYLAVWGTSTQKQFKVEVGNRHLPHVSFQSYRLIHRLPAGQSLPVGYLQVAINLEEARNRLWTNALIKFASNGLTILSVSLVILFLVHMGVTRYLHQMARHAADIDLNHLGQTLQLKRLFRRQREDEIDQVVQALNGLQLRLREDVEQRAQMELRLQQAQKLESLGTLAGGVAHDINNVLGIILGQTEMALAALPPDSPVRDRLELSLQGVDRAKDIVQQILAFSRRNAAQRRPVDISRAVKDALNLLRATIPKTVVIRADIAADCGQVVADPTEIQQVLMNLCNNATQAMGESSGGTLFVTLQSLVVDPDDAEGNVGAPPGSYALLTVRDTGHGMSPQTLERIFEPYFTTKEIGKGTGLGLSVVHGIVIGLKGSISVHSNLGVGTTFRVFLPHAHPGDLETMPPSTHAIPGGSESILLVDDEELLLQTTGDSLEKLGYRVTRFSDSRKALRTFGEKPNVFDCVITDLTMPHLGGAELVAQIRKIRPTIPIVLCTGFSERLDEYKTKLLGIGAFVMKPVLRVELATALRKVLAGPS